MTLSYKKISDIFMLLLLVFLIGNPGPNALRAPVIILNAAWMVVRNFQSFDIGRIRLYHLFWAASFFILVAASRLWAAVPAGVSEVQTNVLWTVLISVAAASYVTDYEVTVDEFAKMIIPVAVIFFANTLLKGHFWNGRMSIKGVNENIYGFLATTVFMFMVYEIKHAAAKTWYVVAAAAMVVCLLLSGSRKAIINMLIILTAIVIYETPGGDVVKKLKYACIAVLGAAAAYILIMNIPALYNSIGVRLSALLGHVFRGEEADSSTFTRTNMKAAAMELFYAHPVYGIGANNFKYATYYGTYSHCGFTEILCSFGIVGAGIYYLLPAMTGLIAAGNWLKKCRGAIIPVCCVLIYLVSEYASVTYFSYQMHLVLGLSAGFAISQYRASMTER